MSREEERETLEFVKGDKIDAEIVFIRALKE